MNLKRAAKKGLGDKGGAKTLQRVATDNSVPIDKLNIRFKSKETLK